MANIDSEKLLISERYSCRKYQETAPDKELIMKVINTAHYAPSACNRQPWRIMVIGPEANTARTAVESSYARPWLAKAPYFLIVCANDTEAWVRPSDNKNHADIDAAIFTEHLCLAATLHGLGACWVCNFDEAELRKAINFPEGIRPVAILPIGIPADEPANKIRKSVEDILLIP